MKIAVTGGKGGTGKSTVATAIAVELAKRNKKVLLIDTDVDCPNDHLILSINRKKVEDIYQRIPKWDFDKCIKCGRCGDVCKYNAIVSIKGKRPIFVESTCNGCGACIIECPVNAISESRKKVGEIFRGKKGKLEMISAEIIPNYPGSAFVVDKEKEYSEKVERKFDFVIVDTSPGAHCNVISALKGCKLALAVTEPTPLGEHDVKLILELLRILKIKGSIVLNKADVGSKKLIKDIARKFNTKIIAEIPYKKEILEAYSRGEPIKDKSIKQIIKIIK